MSPAIVDAARMADLLAGYCLEVKERQQVIVRSSIAGAPLMLELQRAILERDAWPVMRVELPGQTANFYAHAKSAQLDDVPALDYDEAKHASAVLGIQAPVDVNELADVDPAKIARYTRARRDLRERAMKRRWCSTLWPTPAAAVRAGMSLDEFQRFVAKALFLDQPDPVAAWGELRSFQARLIERLRHTSQIRIESGETDLTLSVRKRTWVNSDGRRNMPSGEVFTGPVEDSANGRIHFDVPSGPPGVEVRGVTLELLNGEVISATAEQGEDYLRAALATDDGARRLGEIGIGTNFGIDRPIGAILFDEKIGGTVHLALGRSYPETGGKNVSGLHWDLICDMRPGGRISADGQVICESGRFVAAP